jgi:putative redox protein
MAGFDRTLVLAETTVAPLLRKFGKTVTKLELGTRGTRREVHPTAFEKIELSFHLVSPDASTEDLIKAVSLSEERFCPVWAMIKGNIEIEVTFAVER